MSVMAKSQICRRVRLTFDDGPNPATTPRLLDHLKHSRIRATFFVVGQRLLTAEGRAILERMAMEGHQIGNHGFNHVNMTRLDDATIADEITRTERLIGKLDNGRKLFRPPFGFENERVRDVVKRLGYTVVLWNVCAQDWQADYKNGRWVMYTVDQIKERADCTVLVHDVFPTTVSYFPEFVTAVRSLVGSKFDVVA